jgi:hypothetical protein
MPPRVAPIWMSVLATILFGRSGLMAESVGSATKATQRSVAPILMNAPTLTGALGSVHGCAILLATNVVTWWVFTRATPVEPMKWSAGMVAVSVNRAWYRVLTVSVGAFPEPASATIVADPIRAWTGTYAFARTATKEIPQWDAWTLTSANAVPTGKCGK